MLLELDALIADAGGSRRQGGHALFLTATPWVGPAAYLHIVFSPAPKVPLSEVAERLRFPTDFTELLSHHNGVILFSGSIAVYGVASQGQLIDRTDPYARLPFNIEPENAGWGHDPDRLLVIGGYQEDGSKACMDRLTSEVFVFPRGCSDPVAAFGGLDQWLTSEIARLRTLYDREGRLFGTPEETGPPRPVSREKLN